MKKPTHKIYRTTNWPAYNRALMSRGNIAIWFDPATQWYAPSKGKQGRNQTYSETVKRLGRTLWKKWSGYHRRSLVEIKMHCIKLLGDKLSARSFQSQVNEIHARVAVFNRFTELGRPLTQVTP